MSDKLKRMIGERVRAARQGVGLTQEQLAAAVRRTPESISKIERGVNLPDITSLLEIAAAVQKPLASFLEELEPAQRKSGKREKLEARLVRHVAVLSDEQLAIAVEQVEVLAKRAER